MHVPCHQQCVLIQPGIDDCTQENFESLVRMCI